LLVLEARSGEALPALARPVSWKRAALAGVLLLAVLCVPLLEAMVFRPRLAARLTALKRDQGRLALIDREFEFLRYLRQNQPPYVEALSVLAATLPGGSQVESLTMNRRGELSLKGILPNAQQVVDFRSKLVNSGFFSSVVVAEQTPTPDRQRVNVRMDAQWRAAEERANLLLLAEEEAPKAAGNQN
jgi:Tfp pilus assembly protein PilN